MRVSVGGPQSEIEAAAKKKLITEKEIRYVLENNSPPKELRIAKARMRELLDFYDRIIKSIDVTVRSVKSKAQLTHKQKHDRYLNQQEKELSTAKAEKSKFRRYLRKINVKLNES
jgi:hypothetical protein